MWTRFALIALAGALGSLCRYGLSSWTQRWLGEPFPWGTLAVNVAGSFLFGLVWSVGEARTWLTPELRVVVLVGFMGAFTTFSSFAFDNYRLLAEHSVGLAVLNIASQNVTGLLAVA
ncbi:MAG: fluoride efflux transporter CrcB, partial [Myxococcota bacterium]